MLDYNELKFQQSLIFDINGKIGSAAPNMLGFTNKHITTAFDVKLELYNYILQLFLCRFEEV